MDQSKEEHIQTLKHEGNIVNNLEQQAGGVFWISIIQVRSCETDCPVLQKPSVSYLSTPADDYLQKLFQVC